MLGILGAVAVAAEADRRSEALDKMLHGAGFDYGKHMEKALTSALEQAGYKVVLIPLQRPSERKFVEDYAAVGNDQIDALLDTGTLGVGYFDVNITDSTMRPSIIMQARLISWPGRQTLFSDTILFGYQNALISSTHIPAPSAYHNSDFESVLNHRERAIDPGVFVAQSSAADSAASTRTSAAIPSSNTNARAQTAQPKAAQAKFGKYSFVVEKMAKTNGCQGGTGAYLTTDAGPVEGYRVECDAGVIFVARCAYGKCSQQ